MSSLSQAKSFNARIGSQFNYTPIAVFVGGTSGIGQHTAEALAQYTNGNVHIIIIARNGDSAKRILDSMVRPLDPSKQNVVREFIQCDVALMKNVSAAVRELERLLVQKLVGNNPPRINFLFMSAGYGSLRNRRNDTEEGIDHQLALRYYHRFKFIMETLPLLRAARDAGEDAKVLSVLGAGVRWPCIPKEDFGYKENKNGPGFRAASVSAVYNDLAIEGFAKREPGIAFTHMNPWFVRTPQFNEAMFFSHWFLKWLNPLLSFIWLFFSMAVEDSAEYFLRALFVGEAGAHWRNNYGKEIGLHEHGVDKDRFWKHSLEETRSV
ncbi:hypothetical protein Moror_1985 [Moniliophthora roreri MCA 2997]|uniref:Ketoreductase (KR) domain-containing protein n=2 Tax=Moniliophthora roreri TaxID=221103 RepID=V2X187_MONRO|nr:hypothetical protein Moror_1985 [Moniliophthora roreri MCA 2997]KAI3597805.1 hypothetical protein WG66_012543 [Moniliophthora roreri]